MRIRSYEEESAWLCSLIKDWWANRQFHERVDAVNFDAFAARLRIRARGIKNLAEYAELLRDELWSLGDGHLRVESLLRSKNVAYSSNIGFTDTSEGDICVSWFNNIVYQGTPAREGDVLKIVNGLAPEEYCASVRLRPGSSSWQRRWIAITSLSYQERYAHEPPPFLEVVLQGELHSTYLLQLKWASIPRRHGLPTCVTSELLDDAIGYLSIRSFYCCDEFGQVSDREFQRQLVDAMARLGDAIADLIVDLRWNSGGRDEQAQMAASIFGKSRIEWFRYRHQEYDKVAANSELQIAYLDDFAWPPHITLPTVCARLWLLVGPGTFSTAEVFAAALRRAYSAVCLGDRSGGGAGNPIDFRLPYSGVTVTIPVSEIYMAGQEVLPIETNGIVPDTTASQSAVDLRAGRDSGA